METTFDGYRIKATYLGDKKADWGGDTENWNNHMVAVSRNGRRIGFEFWASIMYPELRGRGDLLQAFACFLSDAIAGGQTFDDFCADFGYDTDSRKAWKSWKACQRAALKARRLLNGDDLYQLEQAVSEAANAS
jgi:hypothetical protein